MPLCPENSYGMDVGRELGEVTADCYLAARLGLIDDATMDRIHAGGYRSEGTPFDQMIHGLQGVNQYLVDSIDGLGASELFALSFLGAMDSEITSLR